MFYAHFVLSKRGPLAKIWLAAHWEKKLTKAQVYETDIDSTVDAILEPKVKLALRTSGHLLLGVVRIYSRKTKYLLADCNEAFVKIKMAFRPGVVDLPDDHREVAPSAITLQENFDDFNANFNDFEMDTIADVTPKFAVNQSRPEEITIKEDVGHINFITDDGFGDVGFDDRELLREASSIEDSLFQTPAPIGDASTLAAVDDSSKIDSAMGGQDNLMVNDGFGDDDDDVGALDADLLGGPGLFEDITMESPNVSSIETKPLGDDTLTDMPPPPALDNIEDEASAIEPASSMVAGTTASETTLLANDEEAFALQPLDNTSVVTGVTGVSVDRRPKRRRKLMVDEQKGIDSQSMKEQLIQTNDIVTTLDLAPPTLKLMQWKESGTVDKLFTLPGRNISNKALQKLYSRNLTVHSQQSLVEEEEKRAKRSRSPETEQARDAQTFAVPAVPDVSAIPEANDMPAPPEETPVANDIEPPPALEDETPRKRQRLDKSAEEKQPQAEDVDSADDMEAPTLEEQESNIVAEESTGDEVEDKRLNRRTHTMLTTLGRHFANEATVSLQDLLKKNHSRKQAAAKFYTCLVLQKHSMISVQQDEPFADIMISRGSNFAKSG